MSLWKQWIWPDVSIRRNADNAIQEAFWITVAIVAFKLAVSAIGFLRDPSTGFPLAVLIDALGFAGLAVGLHFRSRVSAVLAFSLYLLEFALRFVMIGPQLPFLPALVALALFAGVRGTFAYHRFGPKPKDLPAVKQSFQSLRSTPTPADQSTTRQS